MVLRSKPFLVVVASCFVLFQGDFAHAQPKSGGAARSGKRSKPKAAAKAQSTPPATPPAPPPVKQVPVCLRPKDLDKNLDEKLTTWTYDHINKLVVSDVEGMARRTGNRVYVFDKKAPYTSVTNLPLPHSQVKCPGDDRKSEAPAAPKASGFLPSSDSFGLPSTNPLGPSMPILAPAAIVSSGTGKSATTLVEQFVRTALQFTSNGTPDSMLAAQFAAKLKESIEKKKPLSATAANQLTPGAAALLVGTFGESLAAALAQQPVILPLNVLQKMAPTAKNPAWAVFPLVGHQPMMDRDIIEPNEVPAVMLSTADHEHRMKSVASLINGEMISAMMHQRYQQAYADKPEWLSAIAEYFN